MRQISANGGHHLLLLLLLVIHSIHTPAVASRLLRPVANLGDLKIIEGLQAEVLPEEDSWKLTGMKECKEGNEECEKRRMMYEAHLDYIYTQHRRKP